MTELDEAIKDIRMSALLCERDADSFEQHGGSFYEEKAKACRAVAEETYRLADWLEELQKLREGRPQGRWKAVKASIYPYGYDVECSVCGFRMGSSFGYKYCPNCGAYMKGADDE